MSIHGIRYAVEFNAFIPEGSGFLIMDEARGPVVVYRHPSEYALHMARATWHPRGHCATWTDATECRCMLGGDS